MFFLIMNKIMQLSVKRICVSLFLLAVGMPLRAAGRFDELIEKLESLPYGYGLGFVIAIILFFAIILSYAYDIEDKEKRGYGRLALMLLIFILYVVVVYIL